MRSARQDLAKYGPPSQWSGFVAATLTPERRQRMKFEWGRMSPKERNDVERVWRRHIGESLLRLYIGALMEEIDKATDHCARDDVDEASGAGVVGAPGGGPGWIPPKGFALRSSKMGAKRS